MKEQEGSGGIERRTAERVDLEAKIHWRRLSQDEAGPLLHKGSYSGLAAYSALEVSVTQEALEQQAYTENLSTTGLKLVGDLRMSDGSALKKGWELLIEIVDPGKPEPIRALAQVMWVTPSSGPPPRQAGLFFKAVNKEDVERVLHRQAAAKKGRPS